MVSLTILQLRPSSCEELSISSPSNCEALFVLHDIGIWVTRYASKCSFGILVAVYVTRNWLLFCKTAWSAKSPPYSLVSGCLNTADEIICGTFLFSSWIFVFWNGISGYVELYSQGLCDEKGLFCRQRLVIPNSCCERLMTLFIVPESPGNGLWNFRHINELLYVPVG